MILKTFLTKKMPVPCLVQGGVAVHRDQTLSHLYCHNVSHALYMYLLAIAAFMFVITLECSEF